MATKLFLATVLLALLASGCDRDLNNSPASKAGEDSAATAGNLTGPLTASPDSVRACEPSKHPPTTLHWDVTGSGAQKVIITVTNPKSGEEKRFGHGGPTGTKQSGPWLRPGVIFRVRNQANNAELASRTIRSIACD